jgi:hypothetical protein
MGLAGAGAGAARALEEIIGEQMLRAQMEQRERIAQAEIENRRQQLAESARQNTAENALRQQTIDLTDRSRRDRNNQDQLELMQSDKGQMDQDAALAGLPPRLRQIADLRRVGVTGISPQDLNTPEETAAARKADDEADIQKQIRIRNATREPKAPNYEKVLVDGRETFMTPEEVRARGGVDVASRKRASTGMERQALGFFNRMKDALDTMDAVEDQLNERDVMLINDSPLPNLINNRLLSAAGQQYAQALATYTEARLRKESGAAIPESEFATDRKTISRQANDKDDVKSQKRQTRRRTAEGVAYASGPAYEEFYGEPFQRMDTQQTPIRKPIPGVEGGIAESTDGGKTWRRVQ